MVNGFLFYWSNLGKPTDFGGIWDTVHAATTRPGVEITTGFQVARRPLSGENRIFGPAPLRFWKDLESRGVFLEQLLTHPKTS